MSDKGLQNSWLVAKPCVLVADVAPGFATEFPIILSRVEEERGGGRLPVAVAGAFAAAPQSGLPWPRFPSPLIEPDVRISRIRLSDWLHRKAHGGRPS